MSRMEQAATVASKQWPLYKNDPLWCMQYLFAMEDMCHKRGLFFAFETIEHGLQHGCPSHNDNRFIDGFDLLIQLGWVERSGDTGLWCSALFEGEL